MASITPNPKFRATRTVLLHGVPTDVPAAGYLLYTYAAGTTTPKTTYTDSAGLVPNTNPIVLNASGEAEVRLGTGAYKFDLRTAANAIVPGWPVDNIEPLDPAPAALVNALKADLASTSASKGASLIGVQDTPNYFTGTNLEAVLLELGNPKSQFQTDGVNVLRYIPPAEWPAIMNYTSTTNLATYLQSAHSAEKSLIYPDGRYNTASKIVLRTDAKVRGISRRGPQLRATANISIFELPYLSVDVDIERIHFCSNSSNVGTGISVAATAGAFQGYAIGLRVHDCDFAPELAFGLDIDPIVCHIEKNSFGVDGTIGYNPSPGASSFVAMRARQYPSTSNTTNINRFCFNKVFRAGSTTVAGIQLATGAHWEVRGNDIEQGGVVLTTVDINRLEVCQNWMEGNVCANDLMVFSGTGQTFTTIKRNHIVGNTIGRAAINYASTVPTKLDVHGNDFGNNNTSFCLYDNPTTLTTLPASGIISFYENVVSSGNAADKCVTGTEFRGGKTSPKIVITYQTSGGSATILSSSDPGATISYVTVGTALITPSHPLGTSANNVAVLCLGRTANAPRANPVTATSFTIQAYNDASTLADGTVTATAWGS